MVIITRAKEPSDEDSTTLNAEAVQFCEGREFGIECQRPPTNLYPATDGAIYPLCDECLYSLVRWMKKWHDLRYITRGIAEEDRKMGGAA